MRENCDGEEMAREEDHVPRRSLRLQAEAAEEALREEERERRDWFEMLQSEAAFRCWLGLLREMGAGRLMCGEEDMRMRNISDQILDRMAEASPRQFIRMTLALKHMEKSYGRDGEHERRA